MMKRMPLALNVVQKKVLCSAEKSSVIWAEPDGRSSAKQFGRTERSVGHYFKRDMLELAILRYIGEQNSICPRPSNTWY